MKKYFYIIFALLFVAVALLGAAILYFFKSSNYIPALYINGDICEPVSISNPDSLDFNKRISYGGGAYKGIKARDLIELSEPVSDNYLVMFIGRDGRASRIEGNTLEKYYIVFSENGWQAINLAHPGSSNIKGLESITVVSKDSNMENNFNIINANENIFSSSIGSLLLKTGTTLSFIGEVLQKEGDNYNRAMIFEEKKIFNIKDFSSVPDFSSALVMGRKGEYLFTHGLGDFEAAGNKISYAKKESDEFIEDTVGVIIDPPAASIMDAYYDTLQYINSGQKVLLIFLDGFGYHQYEYAIENGYAPFLKNLEPAVMATSVYKPTTNSGFAAMITGKPPYLNGVYSRKQRKIMCDSIFKHILSKDKKALVIEGDIKFLDYEIEPILNTDINRNGTSDDEIFKFALQNLDNGYDFIVAHFHSIDDSGHNYGDLDKNTMKTIKNIDAYIEKLLDNWEGKAIITSDHGMHSTGVGGDHGAFRHEDMIVPYILIK